MATNNVEIAWDSTPTNFTITNLESLADGNIWQSGVIDDATPSKEWVRISFALIFNTTPVAGDSVIFRLAQGDEAASDEIWSGGIGTSESEISTAASIAAIQATMPPVYQVAWQTNMTASGFEGMFDLYSPGPSWQLLIEANGEALTTGNVVRYRYGTSQIQAAV